MARKPSKWVGPITEAIIDIESRMGIAHRNEIFQWLAINKPAIWGSVKKPHETVQAYIQVERYGFVSIFGKDAGKGFYTYNSTAPAAPMPSPTPPPPPLPPPAPPVANTGYSAEIQVGAFMANYGWTVSYVAREGCGYDLEATKTSGGITETRYVEVKSSIKTCNSAILTQNEWTIAETLGSDYWLAIVENFDETIAIPTIYWIQDPYNAVPSTASITTTYRINRGDWSLAATGFR